jgi:hypothetical protein
LRDVFAADFVAALRAGDFDFFAAVLDAVFVFIERVG